MLLVLSSSSVSENELYSSSHLDSSVTWFQTHNRPKGQDTVIRKLEV